MNGLMQLILLLVVLHIDNSNVSLTIMHDAVSRGAGHFFLLQYYISH